MLRMLKFAVPVIALAALALFTTRITMADDAPAAGAASKPSSVKVTVVDADKNAVEGAHVRLMVPQAKNAAGGGAKNQAAGGGKHPAIAEGDTAADGTVQFDNIAPGDYAVMAKKGDLTGRAKLTVTGDGTLVTVNVKIKVKAPAAAAGN